MDTAMSTTDAKTTYTLLLRLKDAATATRIYADALGPENRLDEIKRAAVTRHGHAAMAQGMAFALQAVGHPAAGLLESRASALRCTLGGIGLSRTLNAAETMWADAEREAERLIQATYKAYDDWYEGYAASIEPPPL